MPTPPPDPRELYLSYLQAHGKSQLIDEDKF